jgi:hypothetical protein
VAEVVPGLPAQIDESEPWKLRFDNAFGEGIHLEFEAERDGVHQNIIFDRKIELPQEMNPAASYLYAATELNLVEAISANAVEVSMAGGRLPVGDPSFFTEPTHSVDIVFSVGGQELCRLVDSRVSDSSGPARPGSTVLAEKQLARIRETGKTYLFERVPFSFLAQATRYPIKWDWHEKSGTMNNDETWCPRYTYYLSSGLSLASGKTLTINPGTVVKLKGSSTYISVGGTLIAKGEAYNYVIFTSAYDDNCGEDLDGPGKPLSEAAPAEGDYYMAFQLGSGQTTLQTSQIRYCKFAYATFAAGTAYSEQEAKYDIRDSVFTSCLFGLMMFVPTNATNPAAIRNNLFVNVGTPVLLGSANNWRIQNNTFDGPGKTSDIGVWFYSLSSNVVISYNIFTEIQDPVNGTPQLMEYNAFFGSTVEGQNPISLSGRPYESCPTLGDHYLNNNGGEGLACRSGSWTATPTDAGLYDKVYTVNKPNPVTEDIIAEQTWSAISNATGETRVALGYHHCRMDYALLESTVEVTGPGAILTIEPGVAVCLEGWENWYPDLFVWNGGRVISEGQPGQYNVITTAPMSSMYVKSRTYNQFKGSLHLEESASRASRVRYTRFLWNTYLYTEASLDSPVESNRFECSQYGVSSINASNVIRNNLFYVCLFAVDLYLYLPAPIFSVSANNTCDHCYVGHYVSLYQANRAMVRDCLHTKCDYGIKYYPDWGTLTEHHNAFWKTPYEKYDAKAGTEQQVHDWDILLADSSCSYDRPSGNYADGPQENDHSWFLDQVSGWRIVDKGSYWAEIASHGDYFFSTKKTSADRDTAEGDIGWHPWFEDSDGDGMPDVWESTWGFNPQNPSDAGADADGDGLTNLQEFRAGSKPYGTGSLDSDGDGKNDGTEVGDEDCKSLVGWGPAQHEKFRAGPWLNNLKTNGVTVAWITQTTPGTKQVWIRGEGSSAFENWGSVTWSPTQPFGAVGYVNEGKITNLSPGAWYEYYIVSDAVTTMKFLFRTIPGTDEAFKFIVHDGDFVLNGGTPQHWIDHFFSGGGPMLAYFPLYPVVGNHEYYGDTNLTNYKKLFDYQDEASKTWYCVDYCNSRLIIVNTGPDTAYTIPDTSTQYKDAIYDPGPPERGWLHESQKTWNLVVAHVPPYADQKWSDGSALRGSANLVSGLRDHRADALFSGHSHLYERWLPYHSGEDLIDYFITGGGGAPIHDSYTMWHSEDRVFWEDVDRNFCKVQVTSSSCKVCAYRVDCVDGQRKYEPIDEKELHQTNNNASVLSPGQMWRYAGLNYYVSARRTQGEVGMDVDMWGIRRGGFGWPSERLSSCRGGVARDGSWGGR